MASVCQRLFTNSLLFNHASVGNSSRTQALTVVVIIAQGPESDSPSNFQMQSACSIGQLHLLETSSGLPCI